METLVIYVFLFSVIAIVGQFFSASRIPLPLVFLFTGVLLSYLPYFPIIYLQPAVVLNILLPLLIYQISAFTSVRDIKHNVAPIVSLSIGHVIFITIVVAVVIHHIVPDIPWPLAFLLGAVISPPDDVAIIAIAEKINLPHSVIAILEGEAIFNDATALILFRFALVAVISNQFSFYTAIDSYVLIMLGETAYGLALGFCIGECRARIKDSKLHMIVSLLTPFLAYLPVEALGGSGILATAITGFIIGNYYSFKFTPEFRLLSVAIWPTIGFTIQAILFMLVGINMKYILQNVNVIPFSVLIFYSLVVLATVIIGRFVWVYGVVIFMKLTRVRTHKRVWANAFVIAWSGMRGAISLAAALAVPALPMMIDGVSANSLLLFLVICVVLFTFVFQSLTLPFILKMFGLAKSGKKEAFKQHVSELKARLKMIKAALRWLKQYKKSLDGDPAYLEEVKLSIQQYEMTKTYLKDTIQNHAVCLEHDESIELDRELFLITQIINAEKEVIMQLWREEKINMRVRMKLLNKLDHQLEHRKG